METLRASTNTSTLHIFKQELPSSGIVKPIYRVIMVFLSQILCRVKPFNFRKPMYASEFWGYDMPTKSKAVPRRKMFLMAAHFYLRRRTSAKLAQNAIAKSLERATKARPQKRKDFHSLNNARVEAGLEELNFDHWYWTEALVRSHIHLDANMCANLAIYEPRTFRALTGIASHKVMTPQNQGGMGLPVCGPGIHVVSKGQI
ncbi:large ribosomal subunit protein bL20-like [Tigriopus californicus]|uniref:large ribosomal subunit protein bL20-like n=1 Tax=Tigriopus californicus TaxID=6832 RepID=UPI0027DA9C7F|nr:large ribosomal subunit protein bL20-like [Tigriopus californicus]|eukprot:TCALIF_07909-PA protein Name:"Similar to rplT 50S ribosomal protein L20 (Xanthobacter autotrophicus (strain ATCC BAA-1158 / Py2))" AED:0.01 eAED:0.01 QI:32/1/1/1/1/1/2/39/201